MRFRHEATYQATPAEVRAMLLDPVFRERVCVAVKSVDHSVEVDGTTVTIAQTQRVRKVPAFATKFVGETIAIHQVERWTSATHADLNLTIPGKPGKLAASVQLTEADGGTRHTIDGELKVSIPLVGGKLESLIEGLLKLFLRREQEVGRAWLAGEP